MQKVFYTLDLLLQRVLYSSTLSYSQMVPYTHFSRLQLRFSEVGCGGGAYFCRAAGPFTRQVPASSGSHTAGLFFRRCLVPQPFFF